MQNKENEMLEFERISLDLEKNTVYSFIKNEYEDNDTE